MADTLKNVPLPKGGEWINLYAATGISVGEALEIQALNANGFEIATSATQPASDSGHNIGVKGQLIQIPAGEAGAWARSIPGSAVNVSVFVPGALEGIPVDQAQMVNNSGETVPAEAIQFLDNVMMVGHFGQAITCELDSQVSINWAYRRLDFQFDNDPPVLTGDGVANADGGLGTVSSASAGEAKLDSRNLLRYSNGGGSAGQYDPATSGGIPVGILLNIPYSSAAGNQATPNFSGTINVDQFDLDGKAGETLAMVVRNIGSDPVDIYYTLTNIERQI